MVDRKKRSRIAKKPTAPPPEADAWVGAGGEDPEITAEPVLTVPTKPKPSGTTLLLDDIKNRPGGDTRPLNDDHVQALAESIAAVGLIEPLVVDIQGYLLAGGHRRAAIKYLQEHDPKAYQEQFPGNRIPVRQLEFVAEDEPDRALGIEVTENERRRDYTAAEVKQLAERLRAAGYVDRRGRPKEGELRLKPALEVIIGKSARTVQRLLYENDDKNKNKEIRPNDRIKKEHHLKKAIRALKAWEKIGANDTHEKELHASLSNIIEKIENAMSKNI